MFGHYLTTLYRSLARHRLYTTINVLGLAVGIAVFLIAGLVVRFQTSFEQWIPKAAQIYAVEHTWHLPAVPVRVDNSTMGGLLDELKADYPQTEGVRLYDISAAVRGPSGVVGEQAEAVDPNFLSVFDLPLAAGDRATALAAPDRVVITERIAHKYFGAATALGKRLTLAINGAPADYIVSGVLRDPPKSTDLTFDIDLPLTPSMTDAPRWRHWGSNEVYTYLKFPSAAAARAYGADLDRFTDRNGAADLGPNASRTLHLSLAPVTSLHLAKPADAAAVAALGAVGALALLVAALNYVNLATARAALRARETAVRKVTGATSRALIIQFLVEALITAAVAAFIGLALAELALPFINAAGGASLTLDYFDPLGPLTQAALAVLLVGLGAGVWPAFVLSRFQPAAVLAATRSPAGGRAGMRVREVLVGAQFAIAIALSIVTAVLVTQTWRLAHAEQGFRSDGLIIALDFGDQGVSAQQRSALLDLWRGLKGVTGVTSGDAAPADEDYTHSESVRRPGLPNLQPTIAGTMIGPGFFDVYGAKLLAGRLLDKAHSQDSGGDSEKDAGSANVVLNAGAVGALGFGKPSTAIGQAVVVGGRRLTVVGVIADMRFLSPRTPVPPTLYLQSLGDFPNAMATVRYAGADPREVIAEMAANWRQVAPGQPFSAQTSAESLSAYTRPEEQRASLFAAGALLAVAIGCIGLYGLAAFSAARRVREIGLRKTLGASTADVLRLLIVQFLRPVVLANLIAWPLAFAAARAWLSGFDERITLSPAYFLGASCLALVIAVAAILGQALRVAHADPAKALRQE